MQRGWKAQKECVGFEETQVDLWKESQCRGSISEFVNKQSC